MVFEDNTPWPIFGLQVQPHGRLTLIKKLTIAFTNPDECYLYGNRLIGNLKTRRIMESWQPFFHEEKPSKRIFPFDGRGFARFPMLEELCIDFRVLELEGQGLKVSFHEHIQRLGRLMLTRFRLNRSLISFEQLRV